MLVPLYGFLAGDTLGMIVLVHDHQSIADVAACLREAGLPRVELADPVVVCWRGRQLDPAARIAELGIEPLDRIDVVERSE